MKDETRIVHGGCGGAREIETVNPPVHRASTVLFPSAAALEDAARPYTYGRRGTPTTRALEEALTELEGGARTVLTGSGLSAITTTLLAFTKAGDHVLIADPCYNPTRRFADRLLRKFGVETTYFDPAIGAGLAGLMRPNTRVVFCESPGSHTFEVQDIPAIAAAAHAQEAIVIADNTWASPLYCKPLALGADISLHAATKYIAGHSDLLLGTITANDRTAQALLDAHGLLGVTGAPDDVYGTLRGLRTLGVRMARHQENGLAVARWLEKHPAVATVLHPALPSHPGHGLWKRDFAGASGTFAFVLKAATKERTARVVDALRLFRIGYSFGGFESLALPAEPAKLRTAVPWTGGPTIRLHVGLEDPADLITDLDAALARLKESP